MAPAVFQSLVIEAHTTSARTRTKTDTNADYVNGINGYYKRSVFYVNTHIGRKQTPLFYHGGCFV